MTIPPQLEAIAQQLESGETPTPPTTRTLLGWFGAERRDHKIAEQVRSALLATGLRTNPDFESAYIDAQIQFTAVPLATSSTTSSTTSAIADDVTAVPVISTESAVSVTIPQSDLTYRLSRLRSANNRPDSLSPDSLLTEAVTKMMAHDFSQLPVMSNERDVKGAVSWQSIGKRLALGVVCETARDCMDPVTVVDHDMSIFDAINIIVATDFVLVRRTDRTIGGIVTTSDLGAEFGRLGEPFLLLGEIENHMRRLIGTRFSVKDLETCKDPKDPDRMIDSHDDLTLGEIQRFLDNDGRWATLDIALHRKEFISTLNDVRQIRNDAMHFDTDGVLPEEVQRLREFVQFMRQLQSIGVE
jgi:CBS domain-containing protein